jgi:uncharacterized protein
VPSVPPPLVETHPGPPPDPPERPEGLAPSRPRWAPWTAPLALVAGLGGAIFGAILIGAVAGAAGASIDKPPSGVEIGATFFQDAALIGSALAFARLAARPRSWQFGLRPTRAGAAIGWAALAAVTFYVFSAVWISALGIHQKDNLPDQLGADRSNVALVFVIVLVTVVAPIAEELFFRGYFFAALRNWRGVWPAAVVTGLVFGAIHAGSAPVGFLVPLAFLGLLLCLLYERTGSLYPCIALHAFNNSLAFGSTQHWGWQIPALMVGSGAVIAVVLGPFRTSAGDTRALARP